MPKPLIYLLFHCVFGSSLAVCNLIIFVPTFSLNSLLIDKVLKRVLFHNKIFLSTRVV